MGEAKPQRSSFEMLLGAMMRGDVPTASTFICPECAGPGRLYASPRGELLSVSARCPCSAIEMDGVPKWRGWEAILVPPPVDFDPNPLGLKRVRQPFTAWGLGRPDTIPCPYCGAPLATKLAKQCFVCGTDWHDPANVVCRKNPDWNRFGLKWQAMYVVELCQDAEGKRYTKHREVGQKPDPNAALETPPYPGWQWVAWGHEGFAEHVTTTTGERFTFDAHGMWLTWTEVRWLQRAHRGEVRRDQTPWVTKSAPRFIP